MKSHCKYFNGRKYQLKYVTNNFGSDVQNRLAEGRAGARRSSWKTLQWPGGGGKFSLGKLQ